MSGSAFVSSGALDSMAGVFDTCKSDLSSLSSDVAAHIADRNQRAQDIINELESRVQAAQIQYDRARDAYEACRSQGRDEDGHRPSCRCEKRDMREAEKELNFAKGQLNKGKQKMSIVRSATDEFESGAKKQMEDIVQQQVPSATQRLSVIKDQVENYESSTISGIDNAPVTRSAISQPVASSTTKAEGFSRGMDRIFQKVDSNNANKAAKFRQATETLKNDNDKPKPPLVPPGDGSTSQSNNNNNDKAAKFRKASEKLEKKINIPKPSDDGSTPQNQRERHVGNESTFKKSALDFLFANPKTR